MGRQEIGNKKLNAKFFVRILPGLDFAADDVKIDASAKAMYVKCLQKKRNGEGKENFWRFAADDIFWNSSQDRVYSSVCGDFVRNLLEGVSGMILAYGQSGSGKTFTISGLRHRYENRGLVLRLLSCLCWEREASRDLKRISIGISYVEFIGSEMKDLLRNKSANKVKEIKTIEVGNEIDAWRVIFEAEVRKSANENAPYEGSHRGHSVLTFYVESVSLIESHPVPTCCKVHIVDMAGIDMLGDSDWRSPSDLGYANLSKTLMEQLILCITGKTWKMPRKICPYKTSKLLHFLHDTLQPHCMIRFIGHVQCDRAKLPLTLSVLRFGEKVAGFEAARLEREITENHPSINIKALEMEVGRLKAELDLNYMLSDSPNYSSLSREKLQQIRSAAQNFLVGNLDKLTLLSVSQAEIALDTIRDMYGNVSREKERAVREALEEVHARLGRDRSPPLPTSSVSTCKVSKKRGSRQELSTAPLRPSETCVAGMQKPSATAVQVGQLYKRGINIGQGKSFTSFEGLVTKALKKVRSRKSDTILRPGPKSGSVKDRGVNCSKDYFPGDSEAALPTRLPTKEEAWQEFCAERSDVISDYQEEISRLEENARVARRNYAVALCEMSKVRDGLDKMKRDVEERKHISDLNKYGGRGDGEDCDRDEVLCQNLQRKEVELNNAVEHCHTAWFDLRNSTEEMLETKTALENEFHIFCEDVYKVDVALEEEGLAEMEPKNPAGSGGSDEAANKTRMEMYSLFQKKMLNHHAKNERPEWVARF